MNQALSEHGILGVIAAMALGVIAYLYRQSRSDRAASDAEIKAMRDKHDKDRAEWQERYVAKAESWMKQYREHDESQGEVLKALMRKYEREETE